MGKRITLTDLELEVLSYLVIRAADTSLISSYRTQEIISRPFLEKLIEKVSPPKENKK